jgi:GT2 family glycosyltransferase
MSPKVRIVTLNFDGGEMTLDCLDSLLRLDYPQDRLEIVMVDNASIDGIADRVRATRPRVRVIEAFDNLGFSGGCNLGIRADGDWDYVALLNNDATVGPEWLSAMLRPFDDPANRKIGASCSKMLFADRFRGFAVTSPLTTVQGRYRSRTLGVRISGVTVGGEPLRDHEIAWSRAFAPQIDQQPDEHLARWTTGPAELHIEADPADPGPKAIEIRVSAKNPTEATFTTPGGAQRVAIGTEPEWVVIDRAAVPYDVIQNVGSGLFPNGFGGDCGFMARDTGQFDTPREVFAWCGGAVLMSRAYIDDMGVFDETLFLYYEDTDLAWRGRLNGWTYHYEPTAVVRHRHAASTVEGSSLFRYQVDRNRLLTLAKSAPLSLLKDAMVLDAGQTVATVLFDIVYPLRHRHRPRFATLRHRAAVAKGVVRWLPDALRARRRSSESTRRSVTAQWLGIDA